ncbi:MAG: hypothetical protein HZY79_04630 [Rhodoblastus sp.]|nr:MAG: hypothetical protein HZY79_04630 [Rhodoblastus sp.]
MLMFLRDGVWIALGLSCALTMALYALTIWRRVLSAQKPASRRVSLVSCGRPLSS